MSAITCRNCGQREAFSVVQHLAVVVDVDGQGEQLEGAEFANELNVRWLRCEQCGHAWRTRRWFDLRIDVR